MSDGDPGRHAGTRPRAHTGARTGDPVDARMCLVERSARPLRRALWPLPGPGARNVVEYPQQVRAVRKHDSLGPASPLVPGIPVGTQELDEPLEGLDALPLVAPGDARVQLPSWRHGAGPTRGFLAEDAGDPSLQALAGAVRTRIVEEEAWRAMDPGGRALENANTPEDARRLGLEPDRESSR